MNTVTHLKTRVERLAEKINAAHAKIDSGHEMKVQGIIEVGRQFQQAKAECSHGEWGELTGRTTGKPLTPYSDSAAQRLKSIANNKAISNAAHVPHLPASWGTLAMLASLDPDDIEAAIADGIIHPEMERKDAEALKAKLTPPKAPVIQKTPAPVIPLNPPLISAEERAAIDEGLKEGGQMIADFAERQAEREQVKIELAQRPDHQKAANTYQAILDNLAAADHALANAKDLAYFDMSFWDSAMTHARRVISQLEKLLCK